MRSSLRGLSINSLFETTSYLEFRSSYSDESARIDQVAEPAFDVSQHGGIVIHGRSDATLNPGGVRIGTAEIHSQVEQLHEVAESLCIGQDWDDDIRVILFVLLRDGFDLTEELQAKIKAKIRTGASPRHVPTKIVQVSDIPRTKSGLSNWRFATLSTVALLSTRKRWQIRKRLTSLWQWWNSAFE